mmetsp:Transcript_13998/g.26338  ORF Transcript_13998/g.26338 Transcript_13998/m.26338 type:complete len:180 (-) Transcript_13998:419-958(-)|eukprot:CAMPEP_0176489246 /NCGR_PEP_ID=MMETSP0200_2-20121128/7177_1 /TAXON_ID=947934 /ORGANISM="Chaetoceros sp., Strain GSL56" /LENGTH=179 /DNA_ID=CAMNT_0017886357 /DNA_START=41 /DNA_END=580 /DNA_ORIENTATION=+
MGSSSSSLRWDIDNDFELVVRIAKELDKILTEKFGAADNKTLGEKIEHVDRWKSTEKSTIRSMWLLVKWRNKLVHNYDCNSLEDLGTSRSEFYHMYKEVKRDLTKAPSNSDLGNGHELTAVAQKNSQSTSDTPGWLQAGLILGAVAGAGIALSASAAVNNDDKSDSNGRGRKNNRFNHY